MTLSRNPIVRRVRDFSTRIPHHLVSSIVVAVIAFGVAAMLDGWSVFRRVSLVASDEVSRTLGVKEVGKVELVGINQPLPKSEFQEVTAGAIKSLVETYQAAAVGIDVDFSSGDYSLLAERIGKWSAEYPSLAARVVWAVGFASNPEQRTSDPTPEDMSACDDCSRVECRVRFTPLAVFENDISPRQYGIALAWTDIDGVHRRSSRFVCHPDSEAQLKTFHFALVDVYCTGRTDLSTCRDLKPNWQAETKIYSWYRATPVDVCKLVSCAASGGATAGSTGRPPESPQVGRSLESQTLKRKLAGKIVILYSNVPRDDEHLTMVSTQKGAQIVASLIENELRFGILPSWHATALKIGGKGLFAVLLGFLFHWRYTQRWAILPAVGVFLVYLFSVSTLATWVPDFRDYVFALVLCFWLEVLLKQAWGNYTHGHTPVSHATRT